MSVSRRHSENLWSGIPPIGFYLRPDVTQFELADKGLKPLVQAHIVDVLRKVSYDKTDDASLSAAHLNFKYLIFVARERTADYQTTYGIGEILRRNGNRDDIIAFLEERNLPLDEIGREMLAERILREPPLLGYLTVSNALQLAVTIWSPGNIRQFGRNHGWGGTYSWLKI